ncbi:MAG: bifunctional (p)ppGpp synthetase/guanosine-3',5'-bis(diphosphate) 3'-pyrophosphohydrolase [Bacilli bacterium]|jgi:GTP pyrophosphokinase|nr:bifunctional (p)ppGpp synthetase/guanosine-3',5'-bis(diphosphate) 3'-pyrophosphohydrolase [Bacilli bacterium]NLB40113.1 bifunctional (p)ppGpp synthetase/guanosine-3',5'-bis(diphosphate) 3'-pyrophosphohydrolase [Erysipelotrichaceae bacterium]HNY74223.1 bifunctional (p)ppGpp synthetase/guanosine-3',5'-bis(diphosphate) 3'-pyrophosphohydrolase [Bacilli bacterium]HOH68474.1 bifunctional (p)ppGpp synthetase/guanosine-3',5'-bis(diphosphate) 3'-pyrophosphohydrolase [Bacilli bacterium]HPK67181.1 bifu
MEKKHAVNGGYPLHTYSDLQEVFFPYITDPKSRDMIKEAYEMAKKYHTGQVRKSGEDYIHHLIEVGYILAKLQAGPATIAAGFLHDVIEDTPAELEEVQSKFGEDVSKIVESLTKIQRMKLSHREYEDFEAEDHRKIFLGMAKDVRVIIIKLADRLHNMRTLSALENKRQLALARETLEVFVPIAHRLGINTIKSELEDLSLKYLEPDKYNLISDLLDKKTKNRTKSLDSLKKRVADILFEAKIPFQMESRLKTIYSIYKKIYLKGYNFDDIFDVLAIRVITETELNCYEILGIIHATFKPIPGRFKDYIAVPKPNMYQSLHTSIVSGDGNIFEIQIRTKRMDEIAETGIAAHWRYKEGTNYNAKEEQRQIEEKLHWFRDFVTISNEQEGDAKEYMDTLSKDIFEANVYVFTPKGKVIDLPNGSTPIDFAYRVHTKVGDAAVGAIVNGSLVSLGTVLKTGDVVEIRTSNTSSGPNEGWLKIVRTAQARSHIKKFLLKKNAELMKDERIAKGKQSAIDAFRDRGVEEAEMMTMLNNPNLLNNFHVKDLDELFVAMYSKNPTPSAVIDFLNIRRKPTIFKLDKAPTPKDDDHVPVFVSGAGKIAINLGSCCTPIPGDDIVGYITKGKGVTVHRVTCPNIANERARLVDVFWRESEHLDTYPVDIKIESADRPNLLIDIMSMLSANKISVSTITAKLHPQTMNTTISATIFVSDAKRLTDIFNILLNINSVYEITRVIH